jgi:hypothetical protein
MSKHVLTAVDVAALADHLAGFAGDLLASGGNALLIYRTKDGIYYRSVTVTDVEGMLGVSDDS